MDNEWVDREYDPDDDDEREDAMEHFANMDPDDPDYEYFKNMLNQYQQGMPMGMLGGFKAVPNGTGGFKNIPMTPDELRMLKDLLMGNPVRNFAQLSPSAQRAAMEEERRIPYPHWYFLNREFRIQIVNGAVTEGTDVTMYIEVIKNPHVRRFDYTLLDAYEKLQNNQFITFLLSLQYDLYMWNVDGISMSIVQNEDPMNSDAKIVIIARASKVRPEWFEKLHPIDFVGAEFSNGGVVFEDKKFQVFQHVSVKRHVYEPVIRSQASFTFPSNGPVKFTDPTVDMFAVYNRLVLPVVEDALSRLYPSIKTFSQCSRRSLKYNHLAYETRITDHLLEVTVWVSPGYVVDNVRRVYNFLPMGDGVFAIYNSPAGMLDNDDGQHVDLIQVMNTIYSTPDSQMVHLTLKNLGNIDLFDDIASVTTSFALLFLFNRFPSETLLRMWDTTTEHHPRCYNCDTFDSELPYIGRLIRPCDECFVPINPDNKGYEDKYMRIYGFFEVDMLALRDYDLDSFIDIVRNLKEELIEHLKVEPKEFDYEDDELPFGLGEVWANSYIIRFMLFKVGPCKDLASPELRAEIEKLMKQTRGGENVTPPTDTTPPPKKGFFNKR